MMTDSQEAELAPFVAFLRQNDYLALRLLDGGRRWAGVRRFMFTTAIVTGQVGDYWGLDDRWCYGDLGEALAALGAWDGTGEPAGWHRHPGSGRRVSSGDEYDQVGELVPAGTVYVRR